METTTKKQKAKLSGSFHNYLIANNQSIPEVGKGATQLHYSDRTCYEVIEVSEDGKTVKLESLDAEWDRTKEGGQGHQNWILNPTGNFTTVIWRNNAWRIKCRVIHFTKEFTENRLNTNSYAKSMTESEREAVYAGDVRPQKVVEGITEVRYEYPKIKLLFGTKDYYYDWSF